MSKLNGKVALVTGGGTGIGRAIAEAFVDAGAKVVVTGRREDPLKALANAHPDSMTYVTADVTVPGDSRRALEFAVSKFDQLDVLVNNAGVFSGKPLAETTDEEIALLSSVNFNGLVTTTREALFLASDDAGWVTGQVLQASGGLLL